MLENNDGRRLTPTAQTAAKDRIREAFFAQVPLGNFERVVQHLFSERAYQKRRWGQRMEDGGFLENQREPEAFLLYIQDYLNEAIHYVSRCPETPEAKAELMAMVRKIGALAVAAMEQHGSAPRELQGIVNARDGKPADA